MPLSEPGATRLLCGRVPARNWSSSAVDENQECIELARAKALSLKASADFLSGNLEALDLKDGSARLVIGDLSLVAPERLSEIMQELIRVTSRMARWQ